MTEDVVTAPLSDEDLDELLNLGSELDTGSEPEPEPAAEPEAPAEPAAAAEDIELDEADLETATAELAMKDDSDKEDAPQEDVAAAAARVEGDVAEAKKAAFEAHEREALEQARQGAAEQVEQAKPDIEAFGQGESLTASEEGPADQPAPRTLLGSISVSQAERDLRVDRNNIDAAMIEQAALYGHYAAVATNLQMKADRAKNEIELRESLADAELRKDAAAAGEKVTEAALNKAIARNKAVVTAKLKYAELKQQAAYANQLLEALKQRRDMLVQVGKDRREEMLGDVRISQQQGRLDTAKGLAISTLRGNSAAQ